MSKKYTGGTFSKYGYCIRKMHYKVAPSPKVGNIFGKHWNYSTFIFFLAWNIFTSSGILIYWLSFIPDLIYKTHIQGYCPYSRMKKCNYIEDSKANSNWFTTIALKKYFQLWDLAQLCNASFLCSIHILKKYPGGPPGDPRCTFLTCG